MQIASKIKAKSRSLSSMLLFLFALACVQFALAQAPKTGPGPQPKMPMQIKPDPRAQQRSYHFNEADKDMPYVLYVSTKVAKDKKSPLIIALHGMGGDANFLVRDRLIDLAEENGYIVAGPLGYDVSGWYGSPVISMNKAPVNPPNLTELSEKDVLNVLAMMRKEFNVDNDRTFLLGHSMGGAGALFLGSKHSSEWAAIAAIAPAAFMMMNERKEYLSKLKEARVPAIMVQGERDTVVPPDSARQWVDTMKEIGMTYKYVELPGGDHGTVIGDGMPDIFKFFAEHSKSKAK
jgi:poly(3-hydroxybutyrate) depolymerase